MKNDILTFGSSILFPKVSLKGVKGVLIDLDDTLYHALPAHQCAMQAVYGLFAPFCAMNFEQFNDELGSVWDLIFDEMGNVPMAHHRMTVFQRFAEKYKIEKPYSIATRANMVYFNNVLAVLKKQGPDEKALKFLKRCYKKKIPVCVVTDLFAHIQSQKLKALDLTRYVDYIVANDEVGFDKPHPKMFARALEKLNLTEKDVVMIGDNLKKDIEGAEKLGIRAYQVVVNK